MTTRARTRHAIGFAEVPSFHVAVARRSDPALRDRAVVVGGDPSKRGKVLAASEDLRERGIESGMLVSEALQRSPKAVWVQTDMAHAREVSGHFRAAVRQEIEAIELEGLGAFYWEASADVEHSLALAARVRARVEELVEMPLRVGVAPVRFAARWAAEDAGEQGVCSIPAEALDDYLLRQPIERFPGVGPKTAARLSELGASDVPSLRALGLERLEVLLGNHGRSLWLLACGDDPKPLLAKRHPTTLSREVSVGVGGRDASQLIAKIDRLAQRLASAMRLEGLGAGRIALRLTRADSRTLTRSQTLSGPVSTAAELASAARELWTRTEADAAAVRKVALLVAGLEIQGAQERQLGLF